MKGKITIIAELEGSKEEIDDVAKGISRAIKDTSPGLGFTTTIKPKHGLNIPLRDPRQAWRF